MATKRGNYRINCDLNIQDIGQQILIINEEFQYNLSIIRQKEMNPYKDKEDRVWYTSVEWNNYKSGKRNNREHELVNKINTLVEKFDNLKKKCKNSSKYKSYITSANKFLKVLKWGPSTGSWADSEDKYEHFLMCILDGGYKFIIALLNGKHPGVDPNKLIKHKSVLELLSILSERYPNDKDIQKWKELSIDIKTTVFGSKKKSGSSKKK